MTESPSLVLGCVPASHGWSRPGWRVAVLHVALMKKEKVSISHAQWSGCVWDGSMELLPCAPVLGNLDEAPA